jgi:hypothetical protein
MTDWKEAPKLPHHLAHRCRFPIAEFLASANRYFVFLLVELALIVENSLL